MPKGVVEIIAPWNYPIFTALNGVVPALLAGNTVALKHQSLPAVGEWYAKAFDFRRLDVPASVRRLGQCPLRHLHVDIATSDELGVNADAIAHRVFTGSVRGGRAIMATLGARAGNAALRRPFISSSLELGGCDAAYVHGDLAGDELRHAVEFIMTIGRLHNSGQSCCAVKRSFVHPDAYDAFVEIATANCASQVCGDPCDAKTTIGPNYGGAPLCEGIVAVVLDAHAQGAKVIVAGTDVSSLEPAAIAAKVHFKEREGHFIAPTLLVGATPAMRCMKEEVFGPVLPVATAPTDLDATLALVGATAFGLTASVWTKDEKVAAAFVDAADVGTCYVNWCNDVHAQIVWSGVGLSGNGNGAMGFEGFRVLTNPKSVLKRAKPMVFPPSSL